MRNLIVTPRIVVSPRATTVAATLLALAEPPRAGVASYGVPLPSLEEASGLTHDSFGRALRELHDLGAVRSCHAKSGMRYVQPVRRHWVLEAVVTVTTAPSTLVDGGAL